MKKIKLGDTIALLIDIEDSTASFFAKTGAFFTVLDEGIDANMPSGYSVKIQGFGSPILVDKQCVVHIDDWKRIHNSLLDQYADRLKWRKV